MKLGIIILLLTLFSCSKVSIRRSPASLAKNCKESLDQILNQKNFNNIYDDPNAYKNFTQFINENYSRELRDKIFNLSNKINGHHKERIYSNFFLQLEIAKRSLGKNFKAPKKGWANKSWAYVYVDKFGVQVNNEFSTFDHFIKNLDYYKEKLKVSNLYLLPINKSPKMDGGYDVSDYQKIDQLIGGNKAFNRFMKAAKEKDMNIMIDFVPSHTSREHKWFKEALKGNPKYRGYYLNSKNKISGSLSKEDDNVYRIYKTKDGKEYKRLLLFPDIETHQWKKETLQDQSEHYFYSSFYSFQKDLNLQNPDVLNEHLNTLGYWVSKGVSGIRADAISWWTKLPGTSGQHLDETLFISEYFNTFLKYLNKESLFLPELVDSPETAIRYLGKTSRINESLGGSNSNAVFEFEKSVQIFYAGISGDFTDHYNFLNRTRNLEYPKNTQNIIYSANHHDEIYLGFLSNKAKSNFQNKIKTSGGVVYKGGNSAGAMLADLLNNDHHKMFNFYKFLFAHKGAIAIYQGSALGLKNAWKETYLNVYKQLKNIMITDQSQKVREAFSQIKKIIDHPEEMKIPPQQGSSLWPFIDGRTLHRNKITQEMIDQAMNGNNDFFNMFSKLPSLKESSKALNGPGVEEPLETLRSDIGSFMRRVYDNNGNILQEVAVIKNGTDQTTQVHLNRAQLTNKKSFSLKEIEYNQLHDYYFGENEQSIIIELKPHETLWLEVN